jgi:hypothetical protein
MHTRALTTPQEESLITAAYRELKEMDKSGMLLTRRIDLNAAETLMLISQLQLALKHPDNTGPAARYARQLAKKLCREFPATRWPATAQVLAAGWEEPG